MNIFEWIFDRYEFLKVLGKYPEMEMLGHVYAYISDKNLASRIVWKPEISNQQQNRYSICLQHGAISEPPE